MRAIKKPNNRRSQPTSGEQWWSLLRAANDRSDASKISQAFLKLDRHSIITTQLRGASTDIDDEPKQGSCS
jgi:hypothetical protein